MQHVILIHLTNHESTCTIYFQTLKADAFLRLRCQTCLCNCALRCLRNSRSHMCFLFSNSRRRLRYVASSLWEIYYSQNYYECVNWFFWLCCLSSLGKWLLSTASVCSVSIGRLKLRLHLHHEDFLKHHDGDPFKGWPTKDAFAFAILSNWYFWWVAQCQRCPTHRREHFLTGSLLVGSW